MTEQTESLKFFDLCEREPRLAALYYEARSVDATAPDYDPLEVWYGPGGIKSYVCSLVGWESDSTDPVLTTSEAYDVAYHTLYDALPNSRQGG